MKNILSHWGEIVAGRRGRWVTLLAWVLLVGILSAFWPSVNEAEDNTKPLLPEDAMTREASRLLEEQFPDDTGQPLLIVWYKENGLNNKIYKDIQSIYKKLTEKPLKTQKGVPPLHKAPPAALKSQTSSDGTTVVTPVFFKENTGTEVLNAELDRIKEMIKASTDGNPFEKEVSDSGLIVRLTGPVGIATDATELFSQADVTLLITTVLLVLVLLVVIYRSPILALVPLVGVGFAYGVISPVLGILADQGWITVDSQAVSIMTVLLFGAGTDYCLFLVSRYREYLLEENDKYRALQRAVKASGGAIAMSAITVVLGMVTLWLGNYDTFDRFAAAFSIAVLIMGIAALTLLPAVLTILGRVSFFPFVPRTQSMLQARAEKKGKPSPVPVKKRRFGKKLGRVVTEKPWFVIAASVLALGILASFAPRIDYNYSLLESFPEDLASREGFELISGHFSPGTLAPLQVIADTEGQDASIRSKLQSLDIVKQVSKPRKGETNDELLAFTVTLAENPYAEKAVQSVPDIKNAVEDTLQNNGVANAEDNVWIGGETAKLYVTKTIVSQDEKVIIPVVIAIIAILLLAYLRSVVATVYLILTVLLSYFSALGAGWLILHHWMGTEAIQGLIPLYAFVFLVALGEDYNIFMVSSIWKKRKALPLKQSISDGVSETGGVITAAGLILAGTFAVLATLPLQVLVQFGTVTAIGVLLDTFIVRPLLVPAITKVLGRYAFWPGKLWRMK